MFIHLVQKEYQSVKHKIQEYQALLNTMPKESLICARNGKHYKWYISDGHHITYLPKKQRQLAEQLTYKKYILSLIDDLTQQQKALEEYINYYTNHSPSAVEQITNSPAFSELLSSAVLPQKQNLSDWVNSPYEQNPLYPEQLLYKTSSGIYVRSKSEALISMHLSAKRIPFRYECALHLGETTIYPDFTIRHPITGRIYYWEHFGMMDDPSYTQKVYNKLQLYTSHGILPSAQLITTYESKDSPLSMDFIEQNIAYYLS